MHPFRKSFTLFSILFLLLPSLYASSKKITIVTMSDFHGELKSKQLKTKDGQIVDWGGAGLFSSYYEILKRKSDGPTIILDAGDLFQGTLLSNHLKGSPVVKFFNYLDVSAVAVGNHEFDYGPQSDESQSDLLGTLKARISESNFPYMAANIFEKSGDRPDWVTPSLMIEKNGIKVGVVGATSEFTPTTTKPEYVQSLSFQNPANIIEAEANLLREKGADYVVLLIHEGMVCQDAKSNPSDFSSCNGGLLSILEQLTPDTFDLVIGGHTHHFVMKRYGNTPIIQNYPHYRDLMWVTLDKDSLPLASIQEPTLICGQFVSSKNETGCHPRLVQNYSGTVYAATFMGDYVTPDESIEELLADDLKIVDPIEKRPLGVTVKKDFYRSYYDENAMGNMMSDLLLNAFSSEGDMAMLNNGGVREVITAGALTYGDIYRVLPFDNLPAIMTVKGKTVKKIIELTLQKAHSGLSWSGLTFKAHDCIIDEVKIKGQLLQDEKLYRLISNDFLATGGSGLSSLKLTPPEYVKILEKSEPFRELIVKQLEKGVKKTLHPADYFQSQNRRQQVSGHCNSK